MYEVIEAELRNGYVIPYHPEKIPKSGKALVLILPENRSKPDWQEIRELLGWLKADIDAVQWQKSVRSEWEDRL